MELKQVQKESKGNAYEGVHYTSQNSGTGASASDVSYPGHPFFSVGGLTLQQRIHTAYSKPHP